MKGINRMNATKKPNRKRPQVMVTLDPLALAQGRSAAKKMGLSFSEWLSQGVVTLAGTPAQKKAADAVGKALVLSLIHISEPTRPY